MESRNSRRHEPRPCRGEEPITWADSTTYRQLDAAARPPIGRGDLNFALLESHIPLCGLRNNSLRHFNRSMKNACFDRLAHQRDHHLTRLGLPRSGKACVPGSSSSGGSAGTVCPYRVLIVGVSNALHTWRSLGHDDVPKTTAQSTWDQAPDLAHRHPNCFGQGLMPDARLRSFLPHAMIDYGSWFVATPLETPRQLGRTSGLSCWAPRHMAFGGLGLRWLVRNEPNPYDVVAIHLGMWDASFTSRNITGFEHGLNLSVAALVEAWPGLRIVLFACTPCGGVFANDTTPRTPSAGCSFVRPMNEAIRRIADRYHPSTAYLDTHQMVTTRPGVEVAGSPPGIWEPQTRGWHFAGVSMRGAQRGYRSAVPPLQNDEMWRSFSNRLLDMICPDGAFEVPWHLWDRTPRWTPRFPEAGDAEIEAVFGYRADPVWRNWTAKDRDEMRKHGRLPGATLLSGVPVGEAHKKRID